MSEAKNIQKTEASEQQKIFRKEFLPKVHIIGRTTMAIAFILSFLPTLYFYFIQGYRASISAYVSVTVAICSIGIGMWLTEPLAYWPVLGSAGTYIGYFSGNVGAMRFPVALSLQSALDADINTLRGQIVTIIGIVASVITNLVLLLIFVLGGEWLLAILPEVVLSSFSFVMIGLVASMVMMRWNGKGGLGKGVMESLPYIVLAVAIKLLSKVISVLSTWGMALAVVACVLLAYVFYRRDVKKDAEQAASSMKEE